jgi:short-subunit dehydrogenase
MENQENLVVVITGASSGIGRATALAFAGRGQSVVLAARREEALDQLADICTNLGARALAVPTDVCNENDVNQLAKKAIEKFGRIDVWVNNAAVAAFGRFEEMPSEDIRKVIDTNLFGYIHGARAVIPYFREQGHGHLINVSSMVGESSQPFSGAYTISKFAIRGLSLSLEQELSDVPGIHVSTVLPAVIDTPIFNQSANYMGKEVQAPKPVIPANDVAEKIVALSVKPKKEVNVGGMGPIAKAARSIAPALYDKRIRGKVLEEHLSDNPMPPTKGNLYEPMKQWSSISGGWITPEDRQREKLQKTFAIGVGLAGALIGAAVLIKKGYFDNLTHQVEDMLHTRKDTQDQKSRYQQGTTQELSKQSYYRTRDRERWNTRGINYGDNRENLNTGEKGNTAGKAPDRNTLMKDYSRSRAYESGYPGK